MSAPIVRGAVVDDQTRCAHYAGPLDVVAIRFACCGEWYPFLYCHRETADHDIRPCRCGARRVVRAQLSIREYRSADVCPMCSAPFNPGCGLNDSVYFAG